MKKLVVILMFITVLVSCAKKGRPSGGKKDTEAPIMLKSEPSNYSTNFKGDEIKIYFNEYVKLKDLNKQLIISPPLKTRPLISPQGGASKYVKIQIFDTLQPNTTYSFNFGKSIVDNNEENPYQFFKYVFSTGNSIDSLQLRGKVKDALDKTTDDFVSVMLYEIDSTFTDSIIYKRAPRYITNTLDSTTSFKFENLKAGKYLLMALKEESDNYIFNQKSDKIAFVQDYITLPTAEEYDLTLFKEIQNYKALKPKHERKNRIRFRYEGPYREDLNIKLLTEAVPEGYTTMLTKEVGNDTLNYWFKPSFDLDSLNFVMSYKQEIDTFKVRLRNKIKADSLSFKPLTSTLNFDANYEIQPSIPIAKIDASKIMLMNKDSVAVPFKIENNKLTNTISLKFEKEEQQRYMISAYPEAFTDFFGNKNDTLTYKVNTKTYSAYGNIKVTITNAPKTPIIVQLVTNKGDVKYEKFGTGIAVFEFLNIDAATYDLRVIFDVNGNKVYDTGSYLKKQQPERVSYYPEPIELKPNWDIDQRFTLK